MNGADDDPSGMQDLLHEQIARVQQALAVSSQHALNTLAMHIQFKATTLDMKVCRLLKENDLLRAELSGTKGQHEHDDAVPPDADGHGSKPGTCNTIVAASMQVQPSMPTMTAEEPAPQLPCPSVQRPVPAADVPSAPPQPAGCPVNLRPWADRGAIPAAARRAATASLLESSCSSRPEMPGRRTTKVCQPFVTATSKHALEEESLRDTARDWRGDSAAASFKTQKSSCFDDDDEQRSHDSEDLETEVSDQEPLPKNSLPVPRPLFADATAMKEKVRQNLMKPAYKVSDFYWSRGIAQRIARSPIFDNITLGVIAFNALWISVDTDYNKAATIAEASLVFQIAENFFGLYFTFEWIVRMSAFKRKRDATKDAWFIFDTLLLVVMICEIWLITAFTMLTARGGGSFVDADMSILKIMRLVRTTRMARVAKLLKAVPELMVLLKGMFVATRSVFFTLCLLLVFIYVFAVGLTQLTAGTPVADKYFKDVPAAMASLLLYGTLPDLADMVYFVGGEKIYFAVVLCVFILLATLTVMNMLVGVLVEVVGVVSSVEKEAASITHVKAEMMGLIRKTEFRLRGGFQGGSSMLGLAEPVITKDDFITLLGRPEAARILQGVGVDAVGLVDFGDFIFRDDAKTLSFSDFMEIVLQLRGTNTATVKDIVDMRKFMMAELENLHRTVAQTVEEQLHGSLAHVRRKQPEPGSSRKSTTGYVFNPLHDDLRDSAPAAVVAPDAGPAVSAACCSHSAPSTGAKESL